MVQTVGYNYVWYRIYKCVKYNCEWTKHIDLLCTWTVIDFGLDSPSKNHNIYVEVCVMKTQLSLMLRRANVTCLSKICSLKSENYRMIIFYVYVHGI